MKIIITFLISLILLYAIMFMGSGWISFFNFNNKFIVGTLVYTVFTYFVLTKSDENLKLKLFIAVIAPYLIIVLPFIILSFTETINALISNLSIPLGCFFGFLLVRIESKRSKYVTGVLLCSFTFLVGLVIYPIINHNIAFGNFTGEVSEVEYAQVSFNGSTLTDSVFLDEEVKGKIKILDFWNSSCGYCFRGFPHFNDLTEEYNDNSEMVFLAVNKPLKKDSLPELKERIQNKYNYSFKFLFPKDQSLTDKFPYVLKFPSYMILNQKNEVVYFGNIENLKKYLKNSYSTI